jgi:hypothetical protein
MPDIIIHLLSAQIRAVEEQDSFKALPPLQVVTCLNGKFKALLPLQVVTCLNGKFKALPALKWSHVL